MFTIPLEIILYHAIPMLTGLIVILGLVYLTFIRQYKSKAFPFYSCFLVCFVIFLFGRPLQFYSGHVLAHLILYSRFFILFAVGLPSLLIANKLHCGVSLNSFYYLYPYIIGILGGGLFVMVRDGCTYQILFSVEYGNMLPLMFTEATYSDTLIITTMILLIIPSAYKIFYYSRHQTQLYTLMILVSTLLIGSAYIVGEILDLYWLIYVVALVLALAWLQVGYEDISVLVKQALLLQEQENTRQIESAKNMELHFELQGKVHSLTPTGMQDNVPGKHQHLAETTDLQKPTIKNRELVDKAMSYIKANFAKDIELSDIVQYVNVSESYLIRVFKKVTGKTINQYITSFRVQRAQQLLKNHTVIETSVAVGFKSPSYFSTVFKKQTGLSPLHYQQQLS